MSFISLLRTYLTMHHGRTGREDTWPEASVLPSMRLVRGPAISWALSISRAELRIAHDEVGRRGPGVVREVDTRVQAELACELVAESTPAAADVAAAALHDRWRNPRRQLWVRQRRAGCTAERDHAGPARLAQVLGIIERWSAANFGRHLVECQPEH